MIIAVDPGVSGGISVHYYNCASYEIHKIPVGRDSILALFQLLKKRALGKKVQCWIEAQPKTTGRKRPESRAIVQGENYGFVQMAALACGFNIVDVTPQKWQNGLGVSCPKLSYEKRKKKFQADAINIYKGRIIPKKIIQQVADSLLILEYAKRMEKFI